jgi:hypothetical protein
MAGGARSRRRRATRPAQRATGPGAALAALPPRTSEAAAAAMMTQAPRARLVEPGRPPRAPAITQPGGRPQPSPPAPAHLDTRQSAPQTAPTRPHRAPLAMVRGGGGGGGGGGGTAGGGRWGAAPPRAGTCRGPQQRLQTAVPGGAGGRASARRGALQRTPASELFPHQPPSPQDPQDKDRKLEVAAQAMFGKPFADLDAHQRVQAGGKVCCGGRRAGPRARGRGRALGPDAPPRAAPRPRAQPARSGPPHNPDTPRSSRHLGRRRHPRRRAGRPRARPRAAGGKGGRGRGGRGGGAEGRRTEAPRGLRRCPGWAGSPPPSHQAVKPSPAAHKSTPPPTQFGEDNVPQSRK